MHPDFRMIVLANRPGFPFLGNDFFQAVGKYNFILTLCDVTYALCYLLSVLLLTH